MKKVMRFGFLTFLFLIPIFSNGQGPKNLVEGTILKADSTSASGFIDYQTWNNTPDSILFRNTNGQEEILRPASLKSFKMEDLRFVSLDLNKIPSYTFENTIPGQVEMAFFQVLVEGGYSLLMRDLSGGQKKYFVKTSSEVYFLQDFEKNFKNSPNQKTSLKRYAAVLYEITRDCPNIGPKVREINEDAKKLKDLIIEYNYCRGSGLTFVQKKNPIVDFGITLGALKGDFTLSGTIDNIYFDNMDFSSEWSPQVGIFLDFKTAPNWSISNELFFSRSTYSGENTEDILVLKTNIDQNIFLLNTSIKGYLPVVNRELKLFAAVGPTLTFSGFTASYTQFNTQTGVTTDIDGNFFGLDVPFSRTRLGYFAKVGLYYKRFSIFGRFDGKPGVLDVSNESSETFLSFGASWLIID